MRLLGPDMVTRSYDPEVFRKATEEWRDKVPEDRISEWLDNRDNIMFVVGDNVGLATAEYPGLYNAHWFFSARGKEALDIAFAMYDELFDKYEAKAVRGITPMHLKGARYLAKRIGFTSLGVEETEDGPVEVMLLTKEDFKKEQAKRYGS